MLFRSKIFMMYPDGVGEVGNPVCGDIMKIFLKIENNVVVDAKDRKSVV